MKRFIKFYIRFVQRILITLLLTLLYFTVFSITKIAMLFITDKKKQKFESSDSYWITAEGYTSDMSSALEQS